MSRGFSVSPHESGCALAGPEDRGRCVPATLRIYGLSTLSTMVKTRIQIYLEMPAVRRTAPILSPSVVRRNNPEDDVLKKDHP
jgi:hypothetical protein